jgi:V8-like Glu-specific endopeptidase
MRYVLDYNFQGDSGSPFFNTQHEVAAFLSSAMPGNNYTIRSCNFSTVTAMSVES